MPMSLISTNLTQQQEQFIKLLAAGITISKAATLAQYPSTKIAKEVLILPHVTQALVELKQGINEEVAFTKNQAHAMYMEAFFSSANATEQKMVTDSLVKLYRLDAPPPKTLTRGSGGIDIIAEYQVIEATTSDAELLEETGKKGDYLEPSS